MFSESYTQNAKGKLFIIGGGSKPPGMISRLLSEAELAPGDYAVVLPMSSQEPMAAIRSTQEQFGEAGFKNTYGAMFSKEDLNNQKKLDSVAGAKLIFISGGDQSRFMNLVEGSRLEKVIIDAYQEGSMIAGTSAGAAMMSEIMITGNQLKDTAYNATFRTIESNNIETRKGLGLLNNAIIDQHFVYRSRHNRLISAVLEYPDMQGIGIDESTAILVHKNYAEVIGESQVLVFANPKKNQRIDNGKYGAKGLTLDIYLAGEKFKVGN